MQLLRDSLRSLRNNFRDHDPQHHTLDTLEQGIVSLMDRLHVLHTHRVLTYINISYSCIRLWFRTGVSSKFNCDRNRFVDKLKIEPKATLKTALTV